MNLVNNRLISVFLIFFLGGLAMSAANSEVIAEISKCPKSPNCVSTLTDSASHKMEPWPASDSDILKKVKAAALKEPRVNLISESETHLHFTFKSYVFRFVDDLWFALKDGKVQFKSAARTGYKDFNKNKERMERIKSRVYN